MTVRIQNVVEVVFAQVLENHFGEKLDAATEMKIHAEVVGVLNILYGDFVYKVDIKHTSYVSSIEVHLDAEDPYIVWVEVDATNGVRTKGFA